MSSLQQCIDNASFLIFRRVHGLGSSHFSCVSHAMQIKWICPTAPTRPVAAFGGFPCTACEI